MEDENFSPPGSGFDGEISMPVNMAPAVPTAWQPPTMGTEQARRTLERANVALGRAYDLLAVISNIASDPEIGKDVDMNRIAALAKPYRKRPDRPLGTTTGDYVGGHFVPHSGQLIITEQAMIEPEVEQDISDPKPTPEAERLTTQPTTQPPEPTMAIIVTCRTSTNTHDGTNIWRVTKKKKLIILDRQHNEIARYPADSWHTITRSDHPNTSRD